MSDAPTDDFPQLTPDPDPSSERPTAPLALVRDSDPPRVPTWPAVAADLTSGVYAELLRMLREDRTGTIWGPGDPRDTRPYEDVLRGEVCVPGYASLDDAVTALRSRIEAQLWYTQTVERGEASTTQVKHVRWGKDAWYDAIVALAKERPRNRLVEHIDSCKLTIPPPDDDPLYWVRMLAEYLDAPTSPLVLAMLRAWLVSAVARAYEPGCKVDTVLVLQGAQGARKSSALRALAGPEWFCDSAVDLSTKDAAIVPYKAWLWEWAELHDMLRSRSREHVKAYITSREDTLRPPYGRSLVTRSRHWLVVGTTNADDFLSDETGTRRFWVVPVGITGSRIMLDLIEQHREQIWAWARDEYHRSHCWWLDDEMDAERAVVAKQFESSDEWTESVLERAKALTLGGGTCTIADLLDHLQIPQERWTLPNEHRIGRILRLGGYRSERVMRDGVRRRQWRR